MEMQNSFFLVRHDIPVYFLFEKEQKQMWPLPDTVLSGTRYQVGLRDVAGVDHDVLTSLHEHHTSVYLVRVCRLRYKVR